MPAFDRLLPQDIDAERAALGSVLLDPSRIPEVEACLPDGGLEFSRQSHETLWRIILDFVRTGTAIDSVPIKAALEQAGKWEEFGGFDFLAGLISAVPSSFRAGMYARIVRDKYVLRLLIQTAHEMAEAAHGESFTDACATAERKFSAWVSMRFSSEPELFADVVAEVVKESGDGKALAVPTGIPPWDTMMGGLVPGEVVIVAAYTSVGKTALAMTMARNIAVLGGQPVAWFSNEMSRAATVRRFVTMGTGVPSRAQRKGRQDMTPAQRVAVERCQETLLAAPIHLDVRATRVSSICSHVRRLKRKGIVAVFVDYIQKIRGERAENRNNELGYIMADLSALAIDENLPILCLCQVNRNAKQIDTRPRLWHLRDSGNLEQCARVVALLEPVTSERAINEEQPEGGRIVVKKVVYEKVIVHVEKNSEGETGSFELDWNAPYARFEVGKATAPEPPPNVGRPLAEGLGF